LTHTKLPIDEPVWLTQEGVLNGKDDVVEKAIEWINETVSINGVPTTNAGFYLYNNYPNPFNPETIIEFRIPSFTNVKLSVYDNLGREVSVMEDKKLQPGNYQYTFNGSQYSSGIYYYKLETEKFVESRKMVLLK
jgi:hypothetical protein